MKKAKKILSLMLILIMCFSVMPMTDLGMEASAANYDASAAVAYAAEHWNDGIEQCAGFVSNCLKAGGINVFEIVCNNLFDTLKNTYGIAYKLTVSSNRIPMDINAGKVAPGDPIFYYCNTCNSHSHVVLCSGTDANGYAKDYAHNNPHNDATSWTSWNCSSCNTCNWTMYSVHMVTDTEAPVISFFKADIDLSGYTIICEISDNIGVTKVAFPTWTDKDSQDDLIWHEGTISGNYAYTRINISDHNNEHGQYITHIYAYDEAGNYSTFETSIYVPAQNELDKLETENDNIIKKVSDKIKELLDKILGTPEKLLALAIVEFIKNADKDALGYLAGMLLYNGDVENGTALINKIFRSDDIAGILIGICVYNGDSEEGTAAANKIRKNAELKKQFEQEFQRQNLGLIWSAIEISL